MIKKPLIIIPSYNENTNIDSLLKEIFRTVPDIAVLVIDDNSPDGTAETVRRICAGEQRVKIVVRPKKMGLGTAYLEGFDWALQNGYDAIVTMDADFSHQPSYVPVLLEKLKTADMVIGSRYVSGGGIEGWPLRRRLLSRAGNWYARIMTGNRVKDCTSGFMAIRRELIAEIAQKHIHTEGYAFLIELKYFVLSKGYQVEELPIFFMDRKAGISKISRKIIVEAFFIALRLRLNAFTIKLRGNALFKLIDRYAGIPVVIALGCIGQVLKSRKTGANRVLIIKLSALGDSVLLIPALRALRRHLSPGTKITALCTNINSAVMKACPYIDETIVINVGKIAANPLNLLRLFGKRRFDVALDFDQWLRLSPILSLLSGARTRIGFRTPGQFRHYLYTDTVTHVRKRHEVDCFLDIAAKLGAQTNDRVLEYWVSEEADKAVREILVGLGVQPGERFVILHPETPAHGIQRQWPSERYVSLGKRLSVSGRLKILISGTAREMAANRKMASEIGGNAYAIPPVPINTFAGIVSCSKLVVCGNTGIMHLACALKIPVVALHGPTDPGKWGPVSQTNRTIAAHRACSPCLYLGFEYGCRNNDCMRTITVEEVCRAAEEVLAISS